MVTDNGALRPRPHDDAEWAAATDEERDRWVAEILDALPPLTPIDLAYLDAIQFDWPRLRSKSDAEISAYLRWREQDLLGHVRELDELDRQRKEAPRRGRIGPVAGEPPISLWLSVLTGQEPDADGKIRCTNPLHEDRTPSMHVYPDDHPSGPHVTCYGRCGVQGKMVAVAAMVLGIGEQVGNRWVTDSSERPAVYEHLHNLGLRSEAHRA